MSDLLLQSRFEPVLECRAVSFRAGGLALLEDVSFGIVEEELLGLIGPDKAAQLALLDLCAGLAPHAGTVHACGQALAGATSRDFVGLGLVRCFARPRLPQHGRVLDFLGFTSAQLDRSGWWRQLAPTQRAGAREQRHLLDVLEFLGIARLAEHPLIDLQPYHRRLVDLARALVQRPRVLLMDRPFDGLEPGQRQPLVRLIRSIRDEGVAAVIAEDDLATLGTLCPRMLVLHRGRLIADGPPETVGHLPAVLEAFTGMHSL